MDAVEVALLTSGLEDAGGGGGDGVEVRRKTLVTGGGDGYRVGSKRLTAGDAAGVAAGSALDSTNRSTPGAGRAGVTERSVTDVAVGARLAREVAGLRRITVGRKGDLTLAVERLLRPGPSCTAGAAVGGASMLNLLMESKPALGELALVGKG
jgi:hypothetical protein